MRLPETTLYVPLQFWFCRNPGLALPSNCSSVPRGQALTSTYRHIDECLWAVKEHLLNVTLITRGERRKKVNNCLPAVACLPLRSIVDYVFLDTDERRRMAQNPHEYLIEQLQFTGDESVGSSSNKIKLNFNHPCKELIWVVQPDAEC